LYSLDQPRRDGRDRPSLFGRTEEDGDALREQLWLSGHSHVGRLATFKRR